MITATTLHITPEYVKENTGIVNSLSKASAQYLFKVIEKHGTISRFAKTKELHRAIVHKNCHLDEYCAELIFRAILPPHQKDLEIKEQTLISKESDIFAKIAWPNAAVFGIGADEAGGATALRVFDEHRRDGTRTALSCSQLIADEYITRVPDSIQIVLNDVNMSDAYRGAHQYHLKNIVTAMHGTLLTVHYDEFNKTKISKYLTENWKRAIVDVCLAAMVFAYENKVFTQGSINRKLQTDIEESTWRYFVEFVGKTVLRTDQYFEAVRKELEYHFSVGRHETIDRAIWKDAEGHEEFKQILIIHRMCYAIERSWGISICRFIMIHIWQCLFQQRLLFKSIMEQIRNIPEGTFVKTQFGGIRKTIIKTPQFVPEKRARDARKRKFDEMAELWLYDVSVTNPEFYNVATAVKALINGDYSQKGNNGFGLFLLHDKTINAKIINTGATIPMEIWRKVSDAITNAEPDRWFQLKDAENVYADFVINRNSAHQEHLPSNLIDMDFVEKTIAGVERD